MQNAIIYASCTMKRPQMKIETWKWNNRYIHIYSYLLTVREAIGETTFIAVL